MSHRQRTPPLCRQRYRSPAQPIRPPKPSSFPHKLIASCQHPNSAVKPRPPRRLSLSFLLKPSAVSNPRDQPTTPSSLLFLFFFSLFFFPPLRKTSHRCHHLAPMAYSFPSVSSSFTEHDPQPLLPARQSLTDVEK
ncbi:hypothetical protein HN51_038471 [Arachis hypogaea]